MDKGIRGGAWNKGGKRGDFQTAIERFGDAKLYIGNALMCIRDAKLYVGNALMCIGNAKL